jgi:hypothetical protein
MTGSNKELRKEIPLKMKNSSFLAWKCLRETVDLKEKA